MRNTEVCLGARLCFMLLYSVLPPASDSMQVVVQHPAWSLWQQPCKSKAQDCSMPKDASCRPCYNLLDYLNVPSWAAATASVAALRDACYISLCVLCTNSQPVTACKYCAIAHVSALPVGWCCAVMSYMAYPLRTQMPNVQVKTSSVQRCQCNCSCGAHEQHQARAMLFSQVAL